MRTEKMELEHHLVEKYEHLKNLFRGMEKVLIAYSGGVDSTLLLKVGTDVLGPDKCIGIIGVSASMARDEYQESILLAEQMGARIDFIETDEMNNPSYLANDSKRCFYCKQELFSSLWIVAAKYKVKNIVDGSNADDQGDYRPGMDAAKQLNVRSPLMEADFSKEEIRVLSKFLQLPTWEKPAQPCLASRVAYGNTINQDVLHKIDQSEKYLRNLAFKIVRVRYFSDTVSVEVGKEELGRLQNTKLRKDITEKLKRIGFEKITFDDKGYESGKLNRLISINAE
jgi:uncharacterized protein